MPKMARGQLEDNFVTAIEEPGTGLLFYELSHPWGHNTPTWPGNEDVKIERITYHAKFGVMTQKITMVIGPGPI